MIGNLRVHKHWAMLLGVVATLALILGMSPAVARAEGGSPEPGDTIMVESSLYTSYPKFELRRINADGSRGPDYDDGAYRSGFVYPDLIGLNFRYGDPRRESDVPKFFGYCIEAPLTVDVGDLGTVQDFSSYKQSGNTNSKVRVNPGAYEKINWIAHHIFPAITTDELAKNAGVNGALPKDVAVAATQMAIWHFSDGVDFHEDFESHGSGAYFTQHPEYRIVYDYLIGPANVGQSTVDGSNRTGYLLNSGDKQDKVVVDTETKPSGDKPEQPSTPEQPEEPAKELKPSIKTLARLDGAKGGKVVAGAVVKDTVAFKDLVAGKQYHLDAKLVNKNNENEVLGTGSADFTAKAAEGEQEVIITVSDDVTVPVAAAVAFEKLTSTEVNADGTENTNG